MNSYDISRIYQEMELHLISSMKRNLSRHMKEEAKEGFNWEQWQALKLKELKRYQRENADIIGTYTNPISDDVKELLKEQFREGNKKAQKEFRRALKNGYKYDRKLNKSFFGINDRKVSNLIKDVNNDLKIANQAALRMINDEYRQVIHKAAMFAANGVMTEEQTFDMALKDFLNKGINCIEYKNGRRVNIASYAKMAIRTANQRAQLQGEGEFRKKIGNPLIIISKHGTACELCQVWEGKVLIDDVYSGGTKEDGNYPLLSDAMAQGLYHPNCEHGLSTYYPELEAIEFDENGPTEETLKQYQDDLNYYNLQIQRFKRLEIGSLDKQNINQYKDRRTIYESKKDEVLRISNSDNYIDVTEEWLKNATPNSHEVMIDNYYIDDNNIRHPIDGKEMLHITTKDSVEYERSIWIKQTFGGEIRNIPRISDITNTGLKTSTPDFIWKGKKWDLKTPGLEGKFENTLERFVKKKGAKLQAKKFIVDYVNFANSKTDKEILDVINKTLSSKSRNWIEDLVIVMGERIIKIYSKAK